jgi:MFS family permease
MQAASLKRKEYAAAVYAALVCFCVYSAVYAFRKPFTAGTFSDTAGWGAVGYKSLLVISQVLGYMCSKIYGIRFISRLKNTGRAKLILLLTLAAWLSLLLFAVTPPPFNIVFLFINGFPLGLIWGIVFSFVEGRRTTDFIGAVLAVSFIFASGFVKSVAVSLGLQYGFSQFWLPFITGAVFVLPLCLFVYLLEKIPPPSAGDKAQRAERLPMTALERRQVIKGFLPGLAALVAVYIFLTVFRDVRDNFAADIWRELGFGNQPGKFVQTEIPVTLIVLALMGSMMFIKNNFKALQAAQVMMMAGLLLAGISTLLFRQQQLSAFNWMMLTGLGLYMGYIPVNCMLFDRLIATFKSAANVGFLMYMADSFGYIGSVSVTLAKNIPGINMNWTQFYATGVLLLSAAGVVLLLFSLFYFKRKYKQAQQVPVPAYQRV